MREDFQSFLRSCVFMMLRPITDFCISRGLRFQDFTEIAKRAFVMSAEQKLKGEGRDVSTSKLSVMTGVQRPEVNRVRREPPQDKTKDFIVRIIGRWTSDKRFVKNKRAKRLSVEGSNSEFARLVYAVGSDLNPHTVRFEFERLGLIEVKSGKARLLTNVYVTTGDPKSTLRLGSRDVGDLLTALEENAFTANAVPNLQARTEYDNIPDEAASVIREWFLETGAKLHEHARKFLSQFDRDSGSGQQRGTGRNRVVLGTYSRLQKVEDDTEGEE